MEIVECGVFVAAVPTLGLRVVTCCGEAVVAPLNFVYLPAAAAFCANSFSFAIVAAVRSVRRPDFWRRLRLVTE